MPPLASALAVLGQEWLDLLPSSIGDLSTPDHVGASRSAFRVLDNTGTASRQTRPSPGTVYRTLRQMEKNCDVESAWDTNTNGPARRMYSITDAGEAHLELWIESLKQYQSTVDAFLGNYHRPSNRSA
jgi:Transcriptional regulator PadR-like family